MARLPNDEIKSDDNIRSSSRVKPPKTYLHQSRGTILQYSQLKSRILFYEYEDVLSAK